MSSENFTTAARGEPLFPKVGNIQLVCFGFNGSRGSADAYAELLWDLPPYRSHDPSVSATTLTLNQLIAVLQYMPEGEERDYLDAIGEVLVCLDSASFELASNFANFAGLGHGLTILSKDVGGLYNQIDMESYIEAVQRIYALGEGGKHIKPTEPGLQIGAPA